MATIDDPWPKRSGKDGHPADGMTLEVHVGDGAYMSLVDPRSFEDGGIEWNLRYGNVEDIRFSAASIVSSFDYLLCGEITTTEAIRRLRIMREIRARAAK